MPTSRPPVPRPCLTQSLTPSLRPPTSTLRPHPSPPCTSTIPLGGPPRTKRRQNRSLPPCRGSSERGRYDLINLVIPMVWTRFLTYLGDVAEDYSSGVVLLEIAPHIRLARVPQKWVPVLRTDDEIGQVFFLATGQIP